MIKFVVHVTSLDQLEVLLDAAKTLGIAPELGSVAPSVPPARKRAKGKRSTRKKKRASQDQSLRLGPIPEGSAPKEKEIHAALVKNFKDQVFNRREAKELLVARGIVAHPSTYLSRFVQRGGLIAVH